MTVPPLSRPQGENEELTELSYTFPPDLCPVSFSPFDSDPALLVVGALDLLADSLARELAGGGTERTGGRVACDEGRSGGDASAKSEEEADAGADRAAAVTLLEAALLRGGEELAPSLGVIGDLEEIGKRVVRKVVGDRVVDIGGRVRVTGDDDAGRGAGLNNLGGGGSESGRGQNGEDGDGELHCGG